MLNSYYAEIIDIVGNDIIRYGYTFRDKNMREAKLHAVEVCREMAAVPLPAVWRISFKDYQRLAEKYTFPTMIPWEPLSEEA